MRLSETELQQLLQNLHEALAVEVKSWIDPNTPHGIGKIARACIALRNNNGGYLVIGFDDKPVQPLEQDRQQIIGRSTTRMSSRE